MNEKILRLAEDLVRGLDQLCALIDQKGLLKKARALVAIAGPPGSGKSTLAEALVKRLQQDKGLSAQEVVLVPMDGFHLDNGILEARGLLSRKGSPKTFDADGFQRTITVLKQSGSQAYLPRFDRALEASLAQAIEVSSQARLLIIEGNYLLLKQAPWAHGLVSYDATVFLKTPLEIIRERLLKRWCAHDFSAADALAKVEANDLPNAELVLSQSCEADLVLHKS